MDTQAPITENRKKPLHTLYSSLFIRWTMISSLEATSGDWGARTRAAKPIWTRAKYKKASRIRDPSTVHRALRGLRADSTRTMYWGLAASPSPQPQNIDMQISGV